VNGTASYSYTYNTATTYTMTATYNPTGAFAGSSASCTVVVVAVASKSVLNVTPLTSVAGSPVTLSTTVSPATPPGPATPTGTITFSSSGATIGQATLTAGTASLTVSNLAIGIDQLTCQYSGDAVYQVSPCNIVPETITGVPTTLTLSSSLNPAHAFQPITLTAHLTSPATTTPLTGNITFLSNGTSIGTAPVIAGIATLPVSFPVGSDTLTASYAGTSTFDASTSNSISEVITADSITTSLTVSPNTAAQNTAVTLTAPLTPASSQTVPTGSITFFDGTTSLTSVPVSSTGAATYTSNSFAVGTQSLTAVYSGSANDLASTSPAQPLIINLQDFTLTAPPAFTLQTAYNGNTTVTLASIGSFADTVDLGCGDLPQWAMCTFPDPSPVLGANQTVSASIHIDTDAVLGYKSELRTPFAVRTGIALAMLLPLGLLAAPRRRNLLRSSTLLIALVLTASLLSLTGCSGLYPPSVTPGNYIISITGHGAHTGLAHTTTFTLIVTP
jgi:hypothetical protein